MITAGPGMGMPAAPPQPGYGAAPGMYPPGAAPPGAGYPGQMPGYGGMPGM